jgi:hypothetical protein
MSKTPMVNLELRLSPRIFEKFETALMVYSGAWGKLIHEKTGSRQSRATVPLNQEKIMTHLPLSSV